MQNIKKLFTAVKARPLQFVVWFVVIFLLLGTAVYYYALPHDPAFSTSVAYIQAVGPLQAQDIAMETISASSSPMTWGHMYEHKVGGYLYDTYGVEGIKYCLSYFALGCSNGFMLEIGHVNTLDTVNAILTTCRSLGLSALSGCMHGAGHQALMLNNYNIPKALQLCDTFVQKNTATIAAGRLTLTSCSYGVFMESAVPGVMAAMAQDAMGGKMNMGNVQEKSFDPNSPDFSQREIWGLENKDPLFPCNNPAIESKYLAGCWEEKANEIAYNSTAAKTTAVCADIQDSYQMSYCFLGLAITTFGLEKPTINKATIICNTAPDKKSQTLCLIDMAERVYLDGKYAAFPPDQICEQMDSADETYCRQMLQEQKELIGTV